MSKIKNKKKVVKKVSKRFSAGGNTVLKKYGSKHFSKISAKRWEKYYKTHPEKLKEHKKKLADAKKK